MGSDKRKKHAEKNVKANKKTIQDEGPSSSTVRDAFAHALTSGWVQNSGIGSLFTLIALIVAIFMSTQIKTAAITFALATTAFAWIVAVVVIKYTGDENPPFTLEIIGLMSGEKRDNTHVVAQYNNRLTPVPILLNVRLVNLQSVPATISKLEVEIKQEQRQWILPDKWLKAVLIPDAMPLIWVNAPPEPAFGLELIGDRLDTVLRNRSIQPHETISGWILFDVPAEYDAGIRPLIFRISLRDTARNSFTAIDSGPKGKDINITAPYGLRTTQPVDITGYQIAHWADRQGPWATN